MSVDMSPEQNNMVTVTPRFASLGIHSVDGPWEKSLIWWRLFSCSVLLSFIRVPYYSQAGIANGSKTTLYTRSPFCVKSCIEFIETLFHVFSLKTATLVVLSRFQDLYTRSSFCVKCCIKFIETLFHVFSLKTATLVLPYLCCYLLIKCLGWKFLNWSHYM